MKRVEGGEIRDQLEVSVVDRPEELAGRLTRFRQPASVHVAGVWAAEVNTKAAAPKTVLFQPIVERANEEDLRHFNAPERQRTGPKRARKSNADFRFRKPLL